MPRCHKRLCRQNTWFLMTKVLEKVLYWILNTFLKKYWYWYFSTFLGRYWYLYSNTNKKYCLIVWSLSCGMKCFHFYLWIANSFFGTSTVFMLDKWCLVEQNRNKHPQKTLQTSPSPTGKRYLQWGIFDRAQEDYLRILQKAREETTDRKIGNLPLRVFLNKGERKKREVLTRILMVVSA